MASQTELMRAEIDVERSELARNPEGELAGLTALYRTRGLDEKTADAVARQLSAQPELAWRVHVREELGVDPDDLPSPFVAVTRPSPPSRSARSSRCCRSCSAPTACSSPRS